MLDRSSCGNLASVSMERRRYGQEERREMNLIGSENSFESK